MILVTFLVAITSPGDIALKHSVLFVLAFGLCMAKVTSKLIVSFIPICVCCCCAVLCCAVLCYVVLYCTVL